MQWVWRAETGKRKPLISHSQIISLARGLMRRRSHSWRTRALGEEEQYDWRNTHTLPGASNRLSVVF